VGGFDTQAAGVRAFWQAAQGRAPSHLTLRLKQRVQEWLRVSFGAVVVGRGRELGTGFVDVGMGIEAGAGAGDVENILWVFGWG
jgi:hypothetical protein